MIKYIFAILISIIIITIISYISYYIYSNNVIFSIPNDVKKITEKYENIDNIYFMNFSVMGTSNSNWRKYIIRNHEYY